MVFVATREGLFNDKTMTICKNGCDSSSKFDPFRHNIEGRA